jgi:hypothetical protein
MTAALVYKESRIAAALVYKESRIAAAFRETLYPKRRLSDAWLGAPFVASDPSIFRIPLLSHETWITSFYLFARSQYVS